MGNKTQVRRTRSASKTPREALPPELAALSGELAPFRSLLGALTGRSARDFTARIAVLQAVAENHHPGFSSRELGAALPWLAARTRSAVLRALQKGGWLESHEALAFTATGERAYAALQLIRRGEELASDEVTAALRRKSLGELASAGRAALLPALLPLPFLSMDRVVQAVAILRRSSRA